MKGKFEYYGLKSPIRKEIQQPFLVKNNLPQKDELETIVKELWSMTQREYQYFAMELSFKYIRDQEINEIDLYEHMVIHKSWWDTVDYIAAKLIGAYFKYFPERRNEITKKWMESGNMWLQRSVLLFQLHYKKNTDTKFLADNINKLLGSKEFFINKAIGWVLREYGKTNPDWVLDFANKTDLARLSKKEALRRIIDNP